MTDEFLPYVRANFEGGYVNNGNTQDYRTFGVMRNAHATAFVNYFTNTLAKTVTANCTCVKTYLSADYQLVTVLEPAVTVTAAKHEAVINDIDTIQDALIAMNATIATENADAVTFSAAKIDYTDARV